MAKKRPGKKLVAKKRQAKDRQKGTPQIRVTSSSSTARTSSSIRTLTIDIGASNVKAAVFDERGKEIGEEQWTPTPAGGPRRMIPLLADIGRDLRPFDRASIGFPGVVAKGVIYTSANLGSGWKGVRLQSELRRRWRRPVRVANDADIQGLGCIRGRGVELVLTLGTGIGSSLFLNGQLVPNLELGHHPFDAAGSYEQSLGLAALERLGPREWNRTLRRAIATLHHAFNYDTLILGGGNARLVTKPMPAKVRLVSNRAGLTGGLALWKDAVK